VLIVDGMNVIGSRPDGWWRDRRRAMGSLVERLEALAEEEADPVTVVFDGQPFELGRREDARATVEVRFASRPGPNAADDAIIGLVEQAAHPAELCVVTSDGELADRVRALGAVVQGAGEFRRRLDAL
jgi:predicted RNA-binding protein with PIN domain